MCRLYIIKAFFKLSLRIGLFIAVILTVSSLLATPGWAALLCDTPLSELLSLEKYVISLLSLLLLVGLFPVGLYLFERKSLLEPIPRKYKLLLSFLFATVGATIIYSSLSLVNAFVAFFDIKIVDLDFKKLLVSAQSFLFLVFIITPILYRYAIPGEVRSSKPFRRMVIGITYLAPIIVLLMIIILDVIAINTYWSK